MGERMTTKKEIMQDTWREDYAKEVLTTIDNTDDPFIII